MNFKIFKTDIAEDQYSVLKSNKTFLSQYKAVKKTIGLMRDNIRHPSLNTHEFTTLKGPKGQKVFESYAQIRTPGAYGIFWYYGPDKGELTIVSIVKHPD